MALLGLLLIAFGITDFEDLLVILSVWGTC